MARPPPPPLPGSFALRLEECRGRLPPVRGGRHGQKLHSGPPPPPGGWMPAVMRMPACHGRRFKGGRPIGAAMG